LKISDMEKVTRLVARLKDARVQLNIVLDAEFIDFKATSKSTAPAPYNVKLMNYGDGQPLSLFFCALRKAAESHLAGIVGDVERELRALGVEP